MERDTDSLNGCVVLASSNEVESICPMREYRELEIGTCFIAAIVCQNVFIMEVDKNTLERGQREGSNDFQGGGVSMGQTLGIILLISDGRLSWDYRC